MRQPFVHEAQLRLAAPADDRAPGAAVTAMLCGHWQHDGPCRWPHHTAVHRRSAAAITVRTVFACEPHEEQLVRDRISAAIAAGWLDGPSGVSTWTLVRAEGRALSADERALGQRLARR